MSMSMAEELAAYKAQQAGAQAPPPPQMSMAEELAAFKQQQKGLMQQLLTGRVRVSTLTPNPSP